MALPVSVASAAGHAGEHGNHCGLGHVKHTKGQGGLHTGQTCVKAPHGDGEGDG